jgi:phosphatidylglycerol---prolipoprotein diacylglyceryl transferase
MLAALTFPQLDPVAFYVFSWPVHWYALAYVAGLVLGFWYMKRLVTTAWLWGALRPTLTVEQTDDLFIWAIIGVIGGGRLGYVLFYKPAFYFANPSQILNTLDGGMSFHGGFLGVIIACWMFGRRNDVALDRLLDLGAAITPIGLGLGRIANFINAELWGRPTDMLWGVIFPGQNVPRHPSQLYEAALEGVLLFVFVRFATHRFKALQFPGRAAGLFALGYGLSRIGVEFFREPDADKGYIEGMFTLGMIYSLPLVAVGMWLLLRSRKPA